MQGEVKMFRSLIAVIVALAIAVVGVVKPAYAYSSDSNMGLVNPPITINGDGNSVSFNDSFNRFADEGTIKEPSDAFVDGLVKGIAETTGVVIGGIAVCYALDGIATAFFPPAAAAAAFCPTIGTAGGGAKAVFEAL
jgi:hypothetical protein